MKFSNKVKIKPFIGKDYFKAEQKLLILGESAFGDHKGDKNLLVNVITDIKNGQETSYTQYRKTKVFFTKIFNLFKNKENCDKKTFWNKVSFYDYIQELMDYPGQIPPKNYFNDAEPPFFEILKKIEPDVVIVLGKRLYKNLHFEEINKISYTIESIPIKEYNLNGKMIYFGGINHPTGSRGFKLDIWKKLINKFIKKYIGVRPHFA
jgi:hypothetical protein